MTQLGDVTANKNIQSVVADDVYNLVITKHHGWMDHQC